MLIWIEIKVNGGFLMARGKRKIVTYTGKALRVFEKIQGLESELKNVREELKIAYKEQLKEEKELAIKAKKENQDKILKAIDESGMTTEEILTMLQNNKNNVSIQGE